MYYVYIYIHPDTGIPFYVGKGKGRRKTHHWRYAKNHKNRGLSFVLMQLKDYDKIPIIIEVFHSEDEIETLIEEERLIRFYGRLDLWTGSLCNLDFYTNGVKWTSERRAKHETFHKNNPKGWSIDQYNLDGEFRRYYT